MKSFFPATSRRDPGAAAATCTQDTRQQGDGRNQGIKSLRTLLNCWSYCAWARSALFLSWLAAMRGKECLTRFIRSRDDLFLSRWLCPDFWLLLIAQTTSDKTIFISHWIYSRVARNNTGNPVEFEFLMNNEQLFQDNCVLCNTRVILIQKLLTIYLKFKFNWVPYIFTCLVQQPSSITTILGERTSKVISQEQWEVA